MSTYPDLPNAYLDFLGKFDGYPMSQQEIESYYGNQGWEQALGTTVANVVAIFSERNLIRQAKPAEDIEFLASHLIAVTQLKTLLKQEGLKVSGNKGDLINRLLEHKPSILLAALPDEALFITSDTGRGLVSERLNSRRSRRQLCELAILDLIKEGNTTHAIQTWNQYAQDEPHVPTIDGNRLGREVNILNTIRYNTCAYLASRLPSAAIDALRAYAAIRHLCGRTLTEAALTKLAPDLDRFKQLSNGQPVDVSARMLTFYAIGQENLRSFKRMGNRLVSTSDCSESCQYCQDHSKIRYPIEQAPELPHPQCTHAIGCRCTYLPHQQG